MFNIPWYFCTYRCDILKYTSKEIQPYPECELWKKTFLLNFIYDVALASYVASLFSVVVYIIPHAKDKNADFTTVMLTKLDQVGFL